MYDQQHRLNFAKAIPAEFLTARKYVVESIFESKNDIVFLVKTIENRTSRLIRLLLNVRDGKVLEEKLLFELPRESATPLEFSKNLFLGVALVKYNPVSAKLIVLSNMQEPKSSGYIPFVAYVDTVYKAVTYTDISNPDDAICFN